MEEVSEGLDVWCKRPARRPPGSRTHPGVQAWLGPGLPTRWVERGRVSESWDLVIVVGGDGVVLRQSAGAEGVLGFSPGALVGQNVLEYIHPADAVEGKTAFRRAIEEPGASPPFELRWLHRDGTSRWLQTVANNRISEGEGVVCGSREVIAPNRVAARPRGERAALPGHRRELAGDSQGSVHERRAAVREPGIPNRLRLRPEEAVASGMNVLDYVHPDDLPRVLEDTQKALAGLAQAAFERFSASVTEYRFQRADGSYCWIEGIGAYLLDEPGVEGVIVHARDITARREAEQALRESEELRRAATDGAPVILFALNSEGEFTLAESRGLETLGLERNEVVGGSVFDLHRDGPRTLENNRRALAGEEVTDTVEHGGLYFETRYSPLWDAEGRPQGTVCVATDVTERVRAESETRIRDRALEASSNGVIITDPNQEDNPMIYVNPAFQRISGYQAGEVLGHNCRIFQAGDTEQPELPALAEAIAAEREHSCTIRNYRKDGTLFYNELHVAPVRDASGDLKHFVGI
jgi:PAS domain S-box-containing protein